MVCHTSDAPACCPCPACTCSQEPQEDASTGTVLPTHVSAAVGCCRRLNCRTTLLLPTHTEPPGRSQRPLTRMTVPPCCVHACVRVCCPQPPKTPQQMAAGTQPAAAPAATPAQLPQAWTLSTTTCKFWGDAEAEFEAGAISCVLCAHTKHT
jgi:hypothetical protein